MERVVIHLNIADFPVAVERLLDSTLRARPLLIAEPAARAVVYDMSDEAYADGVRKGMPLALARRRCPAAFVLSPRPEQYRRALGRCLEHALRYTPLVEPANGHGHLYLDVTGTSRLFGSPPDIGWRLRDTLRRDLGLDPIWSVATNKLVAKVASRLVKPCGEYLVAGGEEGTFLAPLPLALLPGLLPADLVRLGRVNIRRVHQATALSVGELAVLCDHRARHIHQTVRGVDPAPVQPAGTGRSDLWHAHTFAPDTNDEESVRNALAGLVQQAGSVLRGRGLGCRRVGVQLLYTDGLSARRQATIKLPVDDDRSLELLALTALYRTWQRRTRLRSLALCCDRLLHPVHQLSLFATTDPGRERQRRLSTAMDTIRARCGEATILRGSQRPADKTTRAI
ncbi:MAG: hypothetical protein RBT36_01570 [Desulfobulbus sp.]|jgi:DNA polymerase-4|nr:hypothetical protein [Desulfobulbus sp.]